MNTEDRMWIVEFEQYGHVRSQLVTLFQTFEDAGQGRNWLSRDTVLLSMMAPFRDKADLLVYHPGHNPKSLAYPVVMGTNALINFLSSINPYLRLYNALATAWHVANIIDRYNDFPASQEGYYSIDSIARQWGPLRQAPAITPTIPGSISQENLIPTDITHAEWINRNIAFDRWLKNVGM